MGFAHVFGIFFMCFKLSHGEITLTINGSDVSRLRPEEHVTVVEGDYLSLKCESNYSGSTMIWITGNNGPITLNDTLKIKGILLHEEGFYSCRASHVNVTETKKVYLAVLVRPSTPVINHPFSCLAGEEIEFVCLSFGIPSPVIEWRENDQNGKLLSRNQTYRTLAPPSDFSVACSIRSRLVTTVGESSYELKTVGAYHSVHRAVTIFIDKGNIQTFKTGENATVFCGAGGNPGPKVWWTKLEDPNFYVFGSRLGIYGIQTSSCGVYVCHGENTMLPKNQSKIYTYASDQVQVIVVGRNGTSDAQCRSNVAGQSKGTENERLSYAAIAIAVIALLVSLAHISFYPLRKKLIKCKSSRSENQEQSKCSKQHQTTCSNYTFNSEYMDLKHNN